MSERPGENPGLSVYLDHHMRTFQGTLHANPDYALWSGWSDMQRDLTEIETFAGDWRDRAKEAAKRLER